MKDKRKKSLVLREEQNKTMELLTLKLKKSSNIEFVSISVLMLFDKSRRSLQKIIVKAIVREMMGVVRMKTNTQIQQITHEQTQNSKSKNGCLSTSHYNDLQTPFLSPLIVLVFAYIAVCILLFILSTPSMVLILSQTQKLHSSTP